MALAKRTLARLAALLLALGPLGCGSPDDDAPGGGGGGGADPCMAPNRLVGERCLEPGMQDDGCPAGSLGVGDGSCQPAGVPPEGCAEGFVHDGDVGCDPILPAEICPDGSMAVPGDTACRPVMDCGEGRWGDIPVDAATLYVDASYDGGASDGSEAQPFTTINEAVAAASDGALIAVAAGSYTEYVRIQKPVRLWGICPERVTLPGEGSAAGTIDIRAGANGSEVVGLAVTSGANFASVAVLGAENVTLERLWVHDSTGLGIAVQGNFGPTSVTIRDTLIERNRGLGVFVLGTQASLEGVVVRDTLPQLTDQDFGVGINIQADLDTSAPATATVIGSLIERNHEAGVFVEGSQASLEGVVVRDTLPRASDQNFGRGVNIQTDLETSAPSIVTIIGSLIERSHHDGVSVAGSQVSLEGVVVRDTLPRPTDQAFGRGVQIHPDLAEVPSTATIIGSLIERSHDIGVNVEGSQASLAGVVVRDTLPLASEQTFGRGVNIQSEPPATGPATVTVIGSLIERSHDVGVLAIEAQVDLEGVVVRQTRAMASDGRFGDGIAFLGAIAPAAGVVVGCLVEDNARAGVVNFGASVTLADTAWRCNALNLAGESHFDRPFVFDDFGGNLCGCGDVTETCQAATAGLSPPGPTEVNP